MNWNAFAWGLIVLLLVGGIFGNDIQFWDEATNLSVVKESSQAVDWWNLRYADDYFWEKPPLFYWINIIVYKVTGENYLLLPYVMRAVTAGTSILLLLVSWLFLRTFSRKAAIGFLILVAATPVFWVFTPAGELATHNLRSADSDVLQLLFIVTAVGAIPYLQRTRRRWLAVMVGGLAGLAVLTKGPLGVAPLIVWALLKPRSGLIYGLLGLAAVVLPWHLLMLTRFGQPFWEEYFLYHQLARADSALEGHAKPWWFYLSAVFDPRSGGIWWLIALFYWSARSRIKFPKGERAHWYQLILIIFLAIQLSSTKIAWYALPVIFGIVFLISSYFPQNLQKLKFKPRGLILILLSALIFWTITSLVPDFKTIQLHQLNRGDYNYCAAAEHRIFNFYDDGRTPQIGTDYILDLNRLEECELAPSSDQLVQISVNYAIFKVE